MPQPSGPGLSHSSHHSLHGQQHEYQAAQHAKQLEHMSAALAYSQQSSFVSGQHHGGQHHHHQHHHQHQHQHGGHSIEGHGVGSSGVGSQGPDNTLYLSRGSNTSLPAQAHHLPTVAEEDPLSSVASGGAGGGGGSALDLVSESQPDLGEYATAAARGGEHAMSPEPTRILVVKNVAEDASDQELQDIFQAFGDVQGLHAASKSMGLIVVAYFDLRCAHQAKDTLQGTLINKMPIDIYYANMTRDKTLNQGQVMVYNLDPETSNDQLVWLFSKFGEVQGIKQSPARPNQKFITFYDVRHAAAAMRAMNRAEHMNKIPSYVTPQQMAALRSVTSGPSLMQLAQMQGMDGPSMGSMPPHSASWDNMSNPAAMENLIQLMQQQQGSSSQSVPGLMQTADAASALSRLSLDPLGGANGRGMALSDSASSIAGVPSNLLLGAGAGKGGLGGGRGPLGGAGMGLDNSQAAAMYNAAQMFQASDAASMLMGLSGDLTKMGAGALPGNAFGAGNAGAGLQDPTGGIWPGAATNPFLANPTAANLNSQVAALQELQIRQQQAAAVQQVQALQAAGAGLNPLGTAANLQAAAQILQAAGLSHLGQMGQMNPYLSNPYNTSAAAQILQQAGLGLGPGFGMQFPGGLLGSHGPRTSDGASNRSGGRLSRRTTDPVAEAERKAQQEKLYALDLDKIGRGEDRRTTLMIKNIPNKYTQKMLLATIDDHFRGTYDFFYLPIDFKNKCNVGYAFINMIQPINIIPLVQRFNHKKWERFNSEKICNISYARIQGRAALVQHFQNSSLMHEDKRCRPILFTLDDNGEVAGEQEAFPANGAPGASAGSSVAGGDSRTALHVGSGGSGTRLSALAGSSNSLRSQGGSSNSLSALQHSRLSASQLASHASAHH